MTGYTKLFGSIVASTIWRSAHTTRVVWITMLAMADRYGEVGASIPGLADLSRVTVDEARAAIAELLAPDPDSRSQEYEGRRIVPIDGGFKILNHDKYRNKLSADDRREYKRKKAAEYRAAAGAVDTKGTNVDVRGHSTEAEVRTGGDRDQGTPHGSPGAGGLKSTPRRRSRGAGTSRRSGAEPSLSARNSQNLSHADRIPHVKITPPAKKNRAAKHPAVLVKLAHDVLDRDGDGGSIVDEADRLKTAAARAGLTAKSGDIATALDVAHAQRGRRPGKAAARRSA